MLVALFSMALRVTEMNFIVIERTVNNINSSATGMDLSAVATEL